jgi:PAS domain S-box-containing protein
VSHSMLTVLGYTFEEASAPGFWEASLHPDDRARVLGGLGGLMAHGRHVHEYRHRHRDGSYRWVRDDIRLVYDAQGTPVRAVGASIDITSRKRDEARLTALVAAQQVVSRLSNRFLSRVHGDAGEAIAEGLAGLARAFEAPSGYLARLGDDGALQARWRVTAQGAAVAGDPDFVTAPAGSEGAAEEARWCWVPMVLGGRRVGVVGVEAPWSEAVDRAELTPLLQLFADTTAAGLRRAEDEASLRAATDRLTAVNVRQQALIELSTALAGTANLRGLERALMAFAPRLLDADQITLGRRLPTGEYVVRVVRYREGAPGDSRPGVGGAFDDPRERVIPTVEALAIGLALRTGRPVTTLDHRVEDFPDWRDLRARDGFEQFAVVPLAGASGSLGTIKFASRSARRWSRDDLSWATQLSLLVGGQLSALEASAALRSVNDDLEARVSQRTRELRASEERFELLFRNAPQAMIICDAGGRVVQSNLAAQELFGYDEAGFTGRPLVDLMPPSARAAHPGLVERFMGRRQARPMAALRAIPARRADGADFSAEIGLVPLELAGEAQVLAGITDVSLRIAAQDALTRSLREKEVLLKEIHHRVKNNLQIISSLLMLQSEKMPAEAARYMHESVYRVRSMALIHQQFYGTESLDRIDLGGHARNLAVSLVGMLCPSARVQVEADPVTVSIDLAVPLGLILNELLTNALKYAVAPSQRRTSVVGDDARREPDIRVRVTSLDGELRLVVHDRGDGLPEGIDPARSGTLGMQLIRSLTRQVRGKLAATNDGGARFEVTCPLPTE